MPCIQEVGYRDLILSFLSPKTEQHLIEKFAGQVLIGRSRMDAVREQARNFYVDIVARMGASPCSNKKSLRQILATSGSNTCWWYHFCSNKDVEADLTYNYILQIFTIADIADSNKIERIVLHGDANKVAAVLANRYDLSEMEHTTSNWPESPLRALLNRFKFGVSSLYHHWLLALHTRLPEKRPEIVLQGFYDWSLSFDAKDGTVKDNYFKNVPNVLAQHKKSFAWILWFSPHSTLKGSPKKLKACLKKVKSHPQFIFLQKFITPFDIIREIFNFVPLIKYLRVRKSKSFQQIFKHRKMDFYPLFKQKLLYHFLDYSLPFFLLIEQSSRSSFQRYQPRLALTFLELFLHSRAFYTGGRRGNPDTIFFTMQHASYNKEKLFFVMDPQKEYHGLPDGYPMPKPDYAFTMGQMGQRILLENGYPAKKVFLTGSGRYDHINGKSDNRKKETSYPLTILLATSLNVRLEMEMVEAVSIAARGIPRLRLLLRSHPFSKIENQAAFEPYRIQFDVSTGSLAEDLQQADLVVFTYSTVAEEALIQGIPVWQWLPLGFNGSAIGELPQIEHFSSVDELRKGFLQFSENPNQFSPGQETIDQVTSQCFFKTDGGAAQRIAAHMMGLLVSPS
nr:F-box protein [uncultured Desulfobacter sp.]